jgi:hypothetical protein
MFMQVQEELIHRRMVYSKPELKRNHPHQLSSMNTMGYRFKNTIAEKSDFYANEEPSK